MLLTHDLGPRRGTSRSVRRLRPQCRAGTAPGLSLDLEETVEAGDASSLGGDPQHAVARAAHEQQHEGVRGSDLARFHNGTALTHQHANPRPLRSGSRRDYRLERGRGPR